MRRWLVSLTLSSMAFAAVVSTPSIASAATATASISGGVLTYTAPSGEENDIAINPTDSPDVWRVSDGNTSNVITPGENCTATTLDDVLCNGPISSAHISTGDGNDFVQLQQATFPLLVLLGPGNDGYTGDQEVNTVFGGPGNDTITTGSADDVLHGGSGSDSLNGLEGADVIDGGTGRDSTNFGRDVNPVGGVTVTEDGIANDGYAGEGDNITNIEVVKGSQHDDTITIHHGAVFAGPGNDRIMFDTGGGNLWGQAGDDMLTAGPTATVLRGGEGDDTLQSRDGVADVDNCSTGVDSVTADAMDSVVNNCENVSIG